MTAPDVAAYCREVESYLCRRNGGHLIRIVGPAFELVRGWAESGVPVSLVQQSIDRCVERRESRREAARPLRIEFCEGEVRDQFQRWRRAVGPYVGDAAVAEGEEAAPAALGSRLTRAAEKLSRAAARMERSEAFRAALDAIIGGVAAVQTEAKGARGDKRAAFIERLKVIDQQMIFAAREEAGRSELAAELRTAASAELAQWRERMTSDAWEGALRAASDRLLRDRLDLPDLAP